MVALERTGGGRSEAGLSLIETMTALTLLSINLLGALSMFVVAQDGISEGAKRLEAMALVETKMERMRVADYRALLTDDASGGGTGEGFPEPLGGNGDEAADAGAYMTRRNIHGIVLTTRVFPDRPALARSRTCTINVTAEWRDHRGLPRTVRLKMRRANPVYGGPSAIGAES
jgi:hypothetical protein